ncbi:3-hydroxyacyl-CoA dehydrogenase PaaC [Actinomadura sp. NBRC 104425]|uniref:3-hydroxyacyl-CoA dehydrogenase n=1 Tax=Actinomadura sp. NBRC 104425 TaxID=3032204 RepID=UPI0024A14413|nr:3-hydroxyacyl-CoA dehydrogenase [Actinomadura sp. NBRC 104425]GLZ11622.1 3-hydroxyacyl-CoA dehydrogenase PaaC [Actinomadura sp. NBRC 104425]
MKETVAVVGTGTMGAGIAQVAALAGHRVLLLDTAPGAADRAVFGIREQVGRLAARGRVDADPDALALTPVDGVGALADARIVIEAIVEDLDAKRRLIAELEPVVAPDCLLASNTSSLSPTALAAGAERPERILGLHFFNPVPRMRLVEVVAGADTRAEVLDRAADLVTAWGKTPVRSAPTPGFIVNRIARPYYAEAWRLCEEQAAAPEVVDAVLTGAGGFPMGPFALMDLIGHDVNEAVTRSVWSAFAHDRRFEPSQAQRALVEAGRLGRKSGRGVYRYGRDAPVPQACGAPPEPAPLEVTDHGAVALGTLLSRASVPVLGGERGDGTVELPGGALLVRGTGVTATALAVEHGAPVVVVDRTLDDATATAIAIAPSDSCPADAVAAATGLLQAAGLTVHVIDDTPGLIVTRTVAMLVNLAADALQHGVATAADIDAAMRLGAGHPLGPLAWGDRWGAGTVHSVLTALQDAYGDPRYRPSPLLRRRALSGRSLA